MAKNDFPKSESCIGCAERSEAHQSRTMRLLSSAHPMLNREIIYDRILSTTEQRQIIGQRGVQTAAKNFSAFMAAILRFKAHYLISNPKK
ncbi:hypothetical protein [Methylobacter sp.]|uniref:hypothetical protein n=1 Tax=Methylobacter sp. TaxID=2051955 RepID=UPI003DA4694A